MQRTDAGKNLNVREGMTEDVIVRWHHRLNGCEFEQGLGVGDGQGRLACCSPWGHKELDTPESLNQTEQGILSFLYPQSYFGFVSNVVESVYLRYIACQIQQSE